MNRSRANRESRIGGGAHHDDASVEGLDGVDERVDRVRVEVVRRLVQQQEVGPGG